MLIRIPLEQERRLLDWAGTLARAELDADLEPSGYTLQISFAPGLGWSAEAVSGTATLDLGDVEVLLQHAGPDAAADGR